MDYPLSTVAAAQHPLATAFSQLVQHAAIGAVRADAAGRFLQVNDRFCEMLGYAPGQLQGRTISDTTHPEDVAESLARVAMLKAGNSGFEVQKRYIHRDGHAVWALSTVTAVRGADGSFEGMVALVQDLGEQKARERRLGFLAELSLALASARGEEDIVRITTSALGQFVGADRCYFLECFEREDRIVVSPCWRREGASDLQGSYSLFAFGGMEWWRQYSGGDFHVEDVETNPLTAGAAAEAYLAFDVRSYAVQPFRSEGARTVVLAITDRVARRWTPGERQVLDDVVARAWPLVERARAEAAAQAAREEAERQRRFLDTLLTVSLDFVSVFDREHRFVYANRALAGFWNLSPQQAIGMTLRQMGHEEWQVRRHEAEIDRVFLTGQPVRDEVVSSLGAYEYIMVPVTGDGGRVDFVMGLTRDVTARRRQAEELRRRAAEKDEFIALLAHELRNPCSALRNGLEVLRMGTDHPRAVAQVRPMMERQLAHLLRMVDDLLDASRLGLRKIDLRPTRVLLATVVADAVEAARPLLEGAGHVLAADLPAEPVVLEADATRLAQVVGNLLHNSVKFTPRGGHIRVVARVEGREVAISVADDGIGIDPDQLGRVFEMFSQADRSIERSTGGLGIGLGLVKGFVELHGGSVSAASEGAGRGTTVTVRLPLPPQ